MQWHNEDAYPADGSRGVGFHRFTVCMSVFLHNISKTDAARITKLDLQMFHDESWKTIYFVVKRSKVTSHKKSAGVGLCTLVSAGFLWFIVVS